MSAAGDALRYVQSFPPGMRRYWLELPSCCRQAFVVADTERDGNPESFACGTHGLTDVAVDMVARAMALNGAIRFRIWQCPCGQKNRVDAAKILGHASQARCGKCGGVVRPPTKGTP